MGKFIISIVAAIGKNRELGKDNKLLWHIPEDLKRFKQLTSGHPIIMGRKTFESIGHALPNRLNVVITRDERFKPDGVAVVHSLQEGIDVSSEYKEKSILDTKYQILNTEHEIFIIGGGQIFEQAMPLADRLYLTIVDATFDADVFFPEYSMFTKVIEKEEHEFEEYKYSFVTLTK
ncbi:MAG: dihydrofolate reductase [Candidatus Levybacteria bacterium]|nr:dihydrofolate reductase [Candidatus Levybacteria bacterium]